ncbi:MAG: dihydroxyacetone kinase family protein [Acidobacteriaceae bacterium]
MNRPEQIVEEMLQGMAVLYPGVVRLLGQKALIRADAAKARDRQVAVVSGGGSGHEPAHAGYIGPGMLSAAVAGEVFTSPSSDAVFAAIRAVAGKPGALLVVKNYTGDRLNFGLAAEMARAEGIAVEMIIVDDDVALQASATGARGLAGTVLIHKLMGAAAGEGKSLAELVDIGKAAIQSLATMGVSFSAGTSPAVGRPSFELGEQEMELGLGIHGEPGVKRMPLQPADQLTETLLSEILGHARSHSQRRVALLINNLGATTGMELAVVARHAMTFLSAKGITVERIFAGTFLSSLDMAGISLSLLGLTDERLQWLDAPTTAPAWPNVLAHPSLAHPSGNAAAASAKVSKSAIAARGGAQSEGGRKLRQAIEAACQALIVAEPQLTELDRITGDADLGISMARGATAIQDAIRNGIANTIEDTIEFWPLDDVSATLKAIGHTLRTVLGGSSGPLYGVLFLRCGNVLEGARPAGLGQWADALLQGCQAISDLGGAKPGDRTMLDALEPFARTLEQGAAKKATREVIFAAVEAADRGAESTAHMKPRLGRSSYLGDRVLGHPDPGAKALAIWLRAACHALW